MERLVSANTSAYAAAGVNIDNKMTALKAIKAMVGSTKTANVAGGIGSFGGLCRLPAGLKDPMLVASTDGVGTKLKIACMVKKHDTVGQDIVNHCVNDILVQGARPLFFMDYVGTSKFDGVVFKQIVAGLCKACKENGMALLGGETAEHPGMMPVDDYDLAGFSVGIVDKKKIIDNTRMRAGDVVIALASTGVHSNGFSLVRKVFDVEHNENLKEPVEALGGKSVLETLLTPTRIYVKSILALLEQVDVKGISHITGGGFYENVPRSIPDGLCAKIQKSSVRVLPIFKLIAETGNIPERDMFNTFNMGVGMSIVVPAEQVQTALDILNGHGETAYVIGEIVENEEKVILE